MSSDKIPKLLGITAAILLALVVLAAGWGWQRLHASLPAYDGERELAGLSWPVTVERDALGVVTIRARDRTDEVRALGFVHAQERFFQMDLLRRSAAGELAALFGEAAAGFDARRRVHRMRRVARAALAAWPDDYRALTAVYADGVNAGLAALGAPPFEYDLLRTPPEPWLPEDGLLVLAAMYFDLQDEDGVRKRDQAVLYGTLPEPLADFLSPRGSGWDAPIDGSVIAPPPVPGPGVYDLRTLDPAWFERGGGPVTMDFPRTGSNNWALAGDHTADGRALVANDMHLGLRVPSIWFRAALDGVSGVTLPGLPFIAAGSNGRVAWGYTNSYGDWTDLILLELHPDDPARYRTPGGWQSFYTVTEHIGVLRGEDRSLEFRTTVWGPVIGELPDGTPYAVRWVAHEPRAFLPYTAELAHAADVHEAVAIAHRAGIPAQNFVAGDAAGGIAWTIKGPMPRRRVTHGHAVDSADGAGWDGWLEADEHPLIVNPAGGRIWTANARVAGGGMLEKIGDGGYDLGARAGRIRDRLRGIERATPGDMLAIQLDDAASFLARWRALLLDLLDDDALAGSPARSAFRAHVEDWGGRAAADSQGYRLVRQFRLASIGALGRALTAEVRAMYPDYEYFDSRSEAWAWALVTERPMHLLNPHYDNWRGQLLGVVDEVIGMHPLDRTWGERNTARIRHPMSGALPLVSRWLDMPADPLPGDNHMPRVQTPSFGASQRMAVAPGDEANGYFHMPGGQSGHPLSPFYGAGHRDWVEGRPMPFLPGPPAHILELVPSR